MKLTTHNLLMLSCILLWMLVTIPSHSHARITLNQDLVVPQGCGTGKVDESYCEPPRCPCTEHAECTEERCCVCVTGYTNVDGACLPECQSGSLDEYCQAGRCECSVTKGECSAETCQCIWGSTAVDGACQCKPGWTEVEGACEPECQSGALDEYCQGGRCECNVTNSECSSGTCQCKPGWTAVDGVCEPECQSGALDEYCQAGRCECSATNAECSSETCQCIPGSTAVDGACQCKQGWTEVDGACEPVVPEGYVKIDGLPGYLKLSEQAKSWEDSRQDCQDDDPFGRSDMVSIESEAKNDKVQGLLQHFSKLTGVWVGLKQKAGEQWKYEWMSGVEVTAEAGELTYAGDAEKPYQNWYNREQIDETGHDDQDCIALWSDDGTWTDLECTKIKQTVCEFIP